jgi:hypothetical protein
MTAALGGVFTLGTEPDEAVHTLSQLGPGKFGSCLVWEGYQGPPDAAANEWQDHHFALYLRMPTGMPLVPGDALTHGAAMLTKIDWIVALMTSLQLQSSQGDVDTGRPVRLLSSGWVRRDDKRPIRVHELRFELTAAFGVSLGLGLDLSSTPPPPPSGGSNENFGNGDGGEIPPLPFPSSGMEVQLAAELQAWIDSVSPLMETDGEPLLPIAPEV